jgi:hypothetical protein
MSVSSSHLDRDWAKGTSDDGESQAAGEEFEVRVATAHAFEDRESRNNVTDHAPDALNTV